jgi:glutamate/tyrosine decarboxylase-like PLP-dependent enzyme
MSVLATTAWLAERFIDNRGEGRVASAAALPEFERWLAGIDFREPRNPDALAEALFDWLGCCGVRNDHPRYFGLFNPPPLIEAVVGDLIAAAVNPQLAVDSHAPAAARIDRRVIAEFAARIGWRGDCAGMFTSGGSEANHTALLAALAHRYPGWAQSGVRGLDKRPAIYASAQSHLAWVKLARMAGLGANAVRLVPMRDGLAMCAQDLADFIARDDGCDPVLIVATAGTTAHGAIDDLGGIAGLARKLDVHCHVDAAWAGAVLLEPGAAHWLRGIERADSVTIDAHKWLAVPMGAGMYLGQDRDRLQRACAVSTDYMPSAEAARDPYLHSIQWSRRAIGLRLFTALAVLGVEGYAARIRHQIRMGDLLRGRLRESGWEVLNRTPLPLVCFAPPDADDAGVRALERHVVDSGSAWISTVRLRDRLVLRACITSHETGERDLDALLDALAAARRDVTPA